MNDRTTKAAQSITDQGKIIQAGWLSYRHNVMPANAGPVQVEETRRVFYAGAQFLFATIMTILEPGTEETEADLQRMDSINEELAAFVLTLRNKA